VKGLLREGLDWIENIVQPCLEETRNGGGTVSWHLLEESGLQEAVIKITNGKWASVEEARDGLEWGRVGGCENMVFRLQRSRNLQTLSADAVFSVKVGRP
jgi:hypothetical protein